MEEDVYPNKLYYINMKNILTYDGSSSKLEEQQREKGKKMSSNKPKKLITTYSIYASSINFEGIRPTTRIKLEPRTQECIEERLALSIKDPSYYGSPDKWQSFLNQGISYFYQWSTYKQCIIEYSHDDRMEEHRDGSGYLHHRIVEVDGGMRALRWASKVLLDVSRRIAKSRDRYYGPEHDYSCEIDDPRKLVSALNSMGGKEIEFKLVDDWNGEDVSRFSKAHEWVS